MPYYTPTKSFRTRYARTVRNRRRPKQRRQYPMRRSPAMVGGYNKSRNFYYTAVLSNASLINDVTIAQYENDYHHGFQFQLQDFPGHEKLAQLFDFYRIKSVKVTLRPMKATPFQFNANTTTITELDSPTQTQPLIARLYSIIDKNDISSNTSLAQYQSDSSLFITRDMKDHVRSFKPRATTAASVGGVAQLVAEAGPTQWFNTSSPDVKYYGMKYCVTGHRIPDVDEVDPVIGQVWSWDVKAVVEFKDPK